VKWVALGAAVLVLAGCGGARSISERDAAEAARQAGFDVAHLTGPKAPSPSAFYAASHVEGDLFYVGPVQPVERMPLAVLWNGSPTVVDDKRSRSARFRQSVVCNVVVSSWNAHENARLTRGYDRLVVLLRERCR
jgi:hypothetical protein